LLGTARPAAIATPPPSRLRADCRARHVRRVTRTSRAAPARDGRSQRRLAHVPRVCGRLPAVRLTSLALRQFAITTRGGPIVLGRGPIALGQQAPSTARVVSRSSAGTRCAQSTMSQASSASAAIIPAANPPSSPAVRTGRRHARVPRTTNSEAASEHSTIRTASLIVDDHPRKMDHRRSRGRGPTRRGNSPSALVSLIDASNIVVSASRTALRNEDLHMSGDH
jgi:hypothetical protein